MVGKVVAVGLAVAGHPIAAVALRNGAGGCAALVAAVAAAGGTVAVVAVAAAGRLAGVLAAEVPVIGCAFAVVCRFALRRLADC